MKKYQLIHTWRIWLAIGFPAYVWERMAFSVTDRVSLLITAIAAPVFIWAVWFGVSRYYAWIDKEGDLIASGNMLTFQKIPIRAIEKVTPFDALIGRYTVIAYLDSEGEKSTRLHTYFAPKTELNRLLVDLKTLHSAPSPCTTCVSPRDG